MATRATKRRVLAWDVSDDFGQRVEPLIPTRQRELGKAYVRKPGGAHTQSGAVGV